MLGLGIKFPWIRLQNCIEISLWCKQCNGFCRLFSHELSWLWVRPLRINHAIFHLQYAWSHTFVICCDASERSKFQLFMVRVLGQKHLTMVFNGWARLLSFVIFKKNTLISIFPVRKSWPWWNEHFAARKDFEPLRGLGIPRTGASDYRFKKNANL